MTKQDRIAVSISVAWLFLGIMSAISSNDWGPFAAFPFLLVIYWGYRFIKNDISFLQRNPKTTAIDSKADALLKWNDLLAKGAITQEEYDKAKRDLLG